MWERVETEEDFSTRLSPDIDVIISDFQLNGFTGARVLELVNETALNVPFIIVSGTIGEDVAVEVMKGGASDYLIKDRLARLTHAVEHAIQQKAFEREQNEERLQRQRDALIALTSTGIADSIEPNEAFRQITETAARTLDVSRTSIWRYNKDRNAIHCIDLFDRDSNTHTSGLMLAAENYPAYFKALAREDVIAADQAETHSATHEFAESYLRPLGITSMLDAATRVAGKVEGVLCHEHVGLARKWTTDESAFAVSMANLVNVTLEGWERRVTLEIVLKVAQAVSTGKVTEFFDLLTRNIIESLDADCAVIGRIDRANPMVCKTLSIASKSRQIENREFPLNNSASEGVSLGYASIIERHARARFP